MRLTTWLLWFLIAFFQKRIFHFLALFQVGFRHPAGQLAHLAEASLALGDTDGTACIQDC